jgi:hypothetical protein
MEVQGGGTREFFVDSLDSSCENLTSLVSAESAEDVRRRHKKLATTNSADSILSPQSE